MKKTDKTLLQRWVYFSVGEKIRAARNEAMSKINQADLAAAAGMSRASIAKIESGQQRFTLDTLYYIAKHLGVQPAELLPNPEEFIYHYKKEEKILKNARAPEGLEGDEIKSIVKSIAASKSK